MDRDEAADRSGEHHDLRDEDLQNGSGVGYVHFCISNLRFEILNAREELTSIDRTSINRHQVSKEDNLMTQSSETQNNHQDAQQELRDAGSCLAMGVGVGTVGTASALLLGATCPICVVMAPALIGMGLVKGYAARKKLKSDPDSKIIPPSHRALNS